MDGVNKVSLVVKNKFFGPILRLIVNVRIEIFVLFLFVLAVIVGCLTSQWTNPLIDSFFHFIDKL